VPSGSGAAVVPGGSVSEASVAGGTVAGAEPGASVPGASVPGASVVALSSSPPHADMAVSARMTSPVKAMRGDVRFMVGATTDGSNGIAKSRAGSSSVDHPVRAVHHAELSDDALVAGLAIEDPDAATAFVRRFQAKVYGLALAVTRDATLADDVAQDAFLRAWRAAGTFDGARGSVAAWLLTITRNAAIDAVRTRRSVPTEDDQLDRLLHVTLAGDQTADEATAHVEAATALRRLRSLPHEQARSVVLAVYGGCTAAEISARDDVPIGTVKTRIRTGLRQLRHPGATDRLHEERRRG